MKKTWAHYFTALHSFTQHELMKTLLTSCRAESAKKIQTCTGMGAVCMCVCACARPTIQHCFLKWRKHTIRSNLHDSSLPIRQTRKIVRNIKVLDLYLQSLLGFCKSFLYVALRPSHIPCTSTQSRWQGNKELTTDLRNCQHAHLRAFV